MTSEFDDSDLDLEDSSQPKPVYLGRRRSSAGTTRLISEVDKAEAEALARKGAAQRRQKLWTTVIGGSVLIAFVSLLTYITAKTLLAPEPDSPYTIVASRTVATSPGVNSSVSVSTGNESDSKLVAFEYIRHFSDQDLPSGRLPSNVTDGSLFCGSQDCKNLASFLNDLISPRDDTCGSLYDQVCSRWARIHERLVETWRRYSVDEAVLDAYRQQVSRLLLDPSLPLADQRNVYADCVNGRLLNEQDMQEIINDIMLPEEGWTPETFATAVAKLSRIGVSPFFDISVQEENDLFTVNLRHLDSIYAYAVNDDIKENWSTSKEKNISSDDNNNGNNNNMVAFFAALERLICQEIGEMSGINRSCVVTSDLAAQASWGFEWYTSTGPTLLARSVASMFEDFSVYNKALEGKTEKSTSFRIVPASEQERSTRCLRFIDQYDPTLVPHLITSYVSPDIQYAAQKMFTPLKATLDRNMPNASAIGIDFIAPVVSNGSSVLYKHAGYFYGSHTATNISRLRQFLITSTWKRWTTALTPETPSLSTMPTLSRNASSVHVPAGVLNLTTVPDKWLQDLSLASFYPRILRAFFSLPQLSQELSKTHFSQCVSGLVKFLHRVGRSPISRQGNGPEWLPGFEIDHKDVGLNIDLEEMASFYLSLQTYRALVGEGAAVPGTVLNSDSLFLLYYAFDNCEVEAGSEATETAGQRLRYARALSYRGMPDDSTDRRRRVDSVAAMFGSLLLEKCQWITDLSTCEMESEEQF